MDAFTLEMAQELANNTGCPVDVYLHNRMWHTVQQGLAPIPTDAEHQKTIHPQAGTTPQTMPTCRLPNFGGSK